MTSRIAILKAEIEEREQEIVRIGLEEEVNRVREEAAKAARITEESRDKSISLINALDVAIDIGEDYIFAVTCVKRSEAKVAEYDGFATMGAYEAREILEENIAEATAVQRKFYPSVQNVLVAMRETELERVQYLQKLGLELATLKKVIGC